MPKEHSAIREGFVAGLIGATSVAVWFLIVDAIAKQVFYTPSILGKGLFSIFGAATQGTVAFVVGYTIFHYAVFILIGIITVIIVHWAHNEQPQVLAGLLILFVVFEMGFYGMVSMLDIFAPFGDLAWYLVAIGNLIAAALMGGYIWHLHPSLSGEFRRVLNGEE